MYGVVFAPNDEKVEIGQICTVSIDSRLNTVYIRPISTFWSFWAKITLYVPAPCDTTQLKVYGLNRKMTINGHFSIHPTSFCLITMVVFN